MKVALFHDLPSGGAKRVLDQQVRRLVASGHRVDAFLPATADESYLPIVDGVTVHRFERPAQPDRARLLDARGSAFEALRWVGYVRHVFAVEKRIARAIDDGRYDLALVHPSQFTQAPNVLRTLRTPSLYYCHEPLRAAYEPWFAPTWVRLALRQTLGRIDRANARAATVVAANSRFTASRCRMLYDRRVRLARPGVDTTRFRPLDIRRESFVLCVGALHRSKGHAFILDALATIAPERRPEVVMVADRVRDAEHRRLVEQAQRLGIRLRFEWRVSEDDLVHLYNRCRAVLYAPHDEPLGLVPLEAMACATPVIGVAEGGLRETVVEGSGVLTPRDAALFGRAVADLIDDPERAAAMGAFGRRYVLERWNWENAMSRLETLCRFTAGHARHGSVR